MCNAISASFAVVACISQDYACSENCHSEFEFALSTKKPIFYVNVGSAPRSAEGGVTGYTPQSYLENHKGDNARSPEAWLLFRMRDALWFDCRDTQRAVSGTSSLLKALRAARVPKTRLPADAAVGVTSPAAALQRGVPRRNSSLFAASIDESSSGGVRAGRGSIAAAASGAGLTDVPATERLAPTRLADAVVRQVRAFAHL
jgi:hypothetical protein